MAHDFEVWLASLRLDEPDEGGDVGTAPTGRAAFLREVFDSHGGAVSKGSLSAAWRDREIWLADRAAVLVGADIRRTTALTPRIAVRTTEYGIVAVTYNGNYQTPAIFSIREPESISEVADNLRDHVVDDLWSVWPICPDDGGGLDPRVIDGNAVWHCKNGDHQMADIGDLRCTCSAA